MSDVAPSHGDDSTPRPEARVGARVAAPHEALPPYPQVPGEVLAHHGARVLDPARATRRGSGPLPSPTVYITDKVVLAGLHAEPLGTDSDLHHAAAELGLRVVAHPDDLAGASTVGRHDTAADLESVWATRVHLLPQDGGPATVDAWRLLAQDRRGAELDYLLTACAPPQDLRGLVGTWDGHGAGGMLSASYGLVGTWDGHGGGRGAYGMPGFSTRIPIAWMGQRDPADGVPRMTNPPVVVMPDSGIGRHPWFTRSPLTRIVHHMHGVPVGVLDPGETHGEHDGISDRLLGVLDLMAGHGTFIAGIVRQAAPPAMLLSLPVMSSVGAADNSEMITALQHVYAAHVEAQKKGDRAGIVDVVTISLGYYHEDGPGHDGILHRLLRAFGEKGVLVVAAAGNDATTTPLYPAGWGAPWRPGAHQGPLPLVSVGAANPNGTVAAFSNGGDWVTCHRPGANVVSTVPTTLRGSMSPTYAVTTPGGRRESLDPDDFSSGFAIWSGTSFAAPRLAGELATALADLGDDALADCSPEAMTTRGWAALDRVLTRDA